MNKYFIIALLSPLLMALSAKSQVYDNDARLWINTALNFKLNKKLSAELMLQNRLNNNFTQYSGYSCYSLTYKVNKHVRATAGYIIGVREELEGNYSPIQQFYAGIVLRKSYHKLSISLRSLIQSQQRGFSLLTYGTTLNLFSRNKLSIKYSVTKRIDLQAGTELYFNLAQNDKYAPIARLRWHVGLPYQLTQSISLEPYFMLQRSFRLKGAPGYNFIYGISLHKQF